MTDKFDALMAKEEELLKKGVSQTMKAYNEKSTVANLRDWEAAKDAYEKFKAKQAPVEVVSFATKREVIVYLIQQGWDVKPDSSKVNDDLKGLPRKQGVWSKKLIDDYASMALRKADGISEELTADAKRKLRAEADRAEEEAVKIKRRNAIERGDYIPRAEVEQEFARRMAFLGSDMERFVYHMIDRIIEVVGGDTEKKPDAIEIGLLAKEEWMDRYSKPLEFMAVNGLNHGDTEGTEDAE